MANNYRNAKIKLEGTVRTVFYTGKSQTTAIFKSIKGCNNSTNGNAVTLSLDTSENPDAITYNIFINRALLSAQDLELLSGDLVSIAQPPPLVVQEGEVLYIELSDDPTSSVDIISSILEIN